jgi:hypothetical protein
LDGYYAEVYKDEVGSITVCYKGRKENIWPKLKKHYQICSQLMRLPDNTILRDELHSPGVHATSVPTMVNDADPLLLLSPFKIEMWAGVIDPFEFKKENDVLKDHGFVVPEISYMLPNGVLKAVDIKGLKQEALDKKIEGWVLRDVPGGNMYKIKPTKTVDAFVVSYKVSDSDQHFGGLKSVEIAVYNDKGEVVIIGTAPSGFKAHYRAAVDMESLIGRVGEFKYQSMGSRGRLKFPGFLRWRDDEKTAKQCTMDQIL